MKPSNMIEKVGAIIIQNKKLLLVSNNQQSFYWTPGGKLEPGETIEQTLKREIQEELNVSIDSYTPYITYISDQEEDGKDRKVYTFMVSYQGEIKLSNEITKSKWVSRSDIENQEILLQSGIKLHLIPQLIRDNLI